MHRKLIKAIAVAATFFLLASAAEAGFGGCPNRCKRLLACIQPSVSSRCRTHAGGGAGHAGLCLGAVGAAAIGMAATSANTLSYGGGYNGFGVVSGRPRSTWWYTVASGDRPAPTPMETWRCPTTWSVPCRISSVCSRGWALAGSCGQVCSPSTAMARACQTLRPHVRKTQTSLHIPRGGAFAGIWYDNASPSPGSAQQSDLGAEAVRAAQHFGNTTATSNRYVQYVILSPTGTTPDGFNTSSGNFCAWHSSTSFIDPSTSASVQVPYTNMPYVYDAGFSCGKNYVNSGASGQLDGYSIVEGHEYAETLTDALPGLGWTNA